VAEAEVQHLRSTSPALQQRPRPTSHAGTGTDAAVDAAHSSSIDPDGSAPQRQSRGSASAAADPGHLPPASSGSSPRAQVVVSSAAHGHSGSDDCNHTAPAEMVALKQRLQEAESEATALRAQLRQLRSDHEATCAQLEAARGTVRELREAVRYICHMHPCLRLPCTSTLTARAERHQHRPPASSRDSGYVQSGWQSEQQKPLSEAAVRMTAINPGGIMAVSSRPSFS
jgi:outer membrane murein-binding lipoprotein Lpp